MALISKPLINNRCAFIARKYNCSWLNHLFNIARSSENNKGPLKVLVPISTPVPGETSCTGAFTLKSAIQTTGN